MTATLYQNVRGALQAQAATAAGFPSQVAYENVMFTSTVGTPYARMTLMPQLGRPFSVSSDVKRHDGLFQVDIFYPANAGTALAEAAADAVRDALSAAKRLAAGSDILAIDYVERAAALQQPDWIQIPVTAKWHCFSVRN